MVKKNKAGAAAPARGTEAFVEFKTRKIQAWIDKKLTLQQVMSATGLGRAVLFKQKKLVKRGIKLQANKGREPYLSKKGQEKLRELISNSTVNDELKKSSQHKANLLQIINDERAEKGKAVPIFNLRRTFVYKLEQSGLFDVDGAVQDTTEARQREERCFRNNVSLCVGMEAGKQKIVPELLFNTDASTFVIGQGIYDGHFWHIKKEQDCKMLTSAGKQAMPILLKYFGLGSAAGKTGRAVIVAAVDSVPADECYPLQIPGLAGSNMQGDFGWLVLMKTRQPNAKFLDWYTREVIVPFVEQQREDFRLYLDAQLKEPCPSMWVLDGEEAQMRLFDDYRIRDLLRQKVIDALKLYSLLMYPSFFAT